MKVSIMYIATLLLTVLWKILTAILKQVTISITETL